MRAMVADAADGPEFVGLRTLWQQVGGSGGSALRTMLLALMPAWARTQARPRPPRWHGTRYFAQWTTCRTAAVAGLKRHPLDHYAMLLLGAIRGPGGSAGVG